MNPAFLALGIFVLTYFFIILEKVHRTIVVIAGGALVVLTHLLTQEEAIEAVDFNTIGLLMGMMIIVGITAYSGLFEYLAISMTKLAKGSPWKILAGLALITAVSSAFLDNVTTVLLITPIVYVIAGRLDISPIPFLVTEIVAANVGGTATLIGDPPNIIIGSAANLSFLDFIVTLGPPIAVIFVLTIGVLAALYRHELVADSKRQRSFLALNAKESIRDPKLLKKSLFVLALVVVFFLVHGLLHIEAATVAMSGAALLLILASHGEVEEPLRKIEWPVIFFFGGLFVIVGALEKAGVINFLAERLFALTHGNIAQTSLVILWGSGFLSALVDNIPFVTAMVPLVRDFGAFAGDDISSLWWALSLGACLGGNMTVIGASCNLTVIGSAERNGFPISFWRFFKIGFLVTMIALAVSSAYLLWFLV